MALRDGEAVFRYHLAEGAAATGIEISNDSGEVVFAGPGATEAGEHTFVWDGRNTQGVVQPDGRYTIRVSARDGANAPVDATTRIAGRVTGVDMTDDGVVLDVDGTPIPFDDVISVRQPEPPPAAAP